MYWTIFVIYLNKSISQRPPTQLNTKIFLSLSLLPDVKKKLQIFFIELKKIQLLLSIFHTKYGNLYWCFKLTLPKAIIGSF